MLKQPGRVEWCLHENWGIHEPRVHEFKAQQILVNSGAPCCSRKEKLEIGRAVEKSCYALSFAQGTSYSYVK